MSKFLNYVKKFLALSFISASVAFLMSYHSNVLGIVQKVDRAQVSGLSSADVEALKKIVGDKFNKDKVYKDKSDSANSVFYAETSEKSDDKPITDCVAVVLQDGATVMASLGASSTGGTPVSKVNKIVAPEGVKISDLVIDSWDEETPIDGDSIKGMLKHFIVTNLKNAPEKKDDGTTSKLPFIPKNTVFYDGSFFATSEQGSAFVKGIANGNGKLFASSNDTWSLWLANILYKAPQATGSVKVDGKTPPEGKISITQSPTNISLSYEPNADNSYFKKETISIELYPLSSFYSVVQELCRKNTGDNNVVDLSKKNLETCVDEYLKLTTAAKTSPEIVIGNQTVSPKDLLGDYSSGYVLSAAIKDLCSQYPSSSRTLDSALTAFYKGDLILSAAEKSYLLSRIDAYYASLEKEFGAEIKNAAESSITDLKKIVNSLPSSPTNTPKNTTPSTSTSKTPTTSAKIKTGSESLLLLLSSFGLSSGTLLTLRKRRDD